MHLPRGLAIFESRVRFSRDEHCIAFSASVYRKDLPHLYAFSLRLSHVCSRVVRSFLVSQAGSLPRTLTAPPSSRARGVRVVPHHIGSPQSASDRLNFLDVSQARTLAKFVAYGQD